MAINDAGTSVVVGKPQIVRADGAERAEPAIFRSTRLASSSGDTTWTTPQGYQSPLKPSSDYVTSMLGSTVAIDSTGTTVAAGAPWYRPFRSGGDFGVVLVWGCGAS